MKFSFTPADNDVITLKVAFPTFVYTCSGPEHTFLKIMESGVALCVKTLKTAECEMVEIHNNFIEKRIMENWFKLTFESGTAAFIAQETFDSAYARARVHLEAIHRNFRPAGLDVLQLLALDAKYPTTVRPI